MKTETFYNALCAYFEPDGSIQRVWKTFYLYRSLEEASLDLEKRLLFQPELGSGQAKIVRLLTENPIVIETKNEVSEREKV